MIKYSCSQCFLFYHSLGDDVKNGFKELNNGNMLKAKELFTKGCDERMQMGVIILG